MRSACRGPQAQVGPLVVGPSRYRLYLPSGSAYVDVGSASCAAAWPSGQMHATPAITVAASPPRKPRLSQRRPASNAPHEVGDSLSEGRWSVRRRIRTETDRTVTSPLPCLGRIARSRSGPGPPHPPPGAGTPERWIGQKPQTTSLRACPFRRWLPTDTPNAIHSINVDATNGANHRRLTADTRNHSEIQEPLRSVASANVSGC